MGGGEGPPRWNLTSDLTITFQPHSGKCLSCATSPSKPFLSFSSVEPSREETPLPSPPSSPLLLVFLCSTAVHSVTSVSEMTRIQLLSSFTPQRVKPVPVDFNVWIYDLDRGPACSCRNRSLYCSFPPFFLPLCFSVSFPKH